MRPRLLLLGSVLAACLAALLLPPSASAAPAALPPGSSMNVLQLNLCNSGVASCYEGGQSVPEAYGVITSRRPDVVTLNEICKADVQVSLAPAMAEMYPNDRTFWAFAPAYNRATGAPYLCSNGDQYGVGILGHVPAAQWAGTKTFSDRYPMQRSDSNELRTWVCVEAVGNYFACTTHLASGASAVAFDQCNHLMRTVIPSIWSAEGTLPSVVGGDFNLRYRGIPNVQDCVPSGWYRKGDGDVQHVMATTNLPFVSSEKIGLSHTDHPGWLVRTRVS
jgi:hypothetical protein